MEFLIPCHNTFNKMLKKSKSLSQEHKDLISTAIFVGTSIGIESKSSFPPTSSPQLWDSHPIISTSVLGHYLKQASL